MNIFNVRREEYKYYINNADLYTLKHLISRVMSIDAYADPIKNHYIDQNLLHDIDGSKKIEQIYGEIRNIIDSLET